MLSVFDAVSNKLSTAEDKAYTALDASSGDRTPLYGVDPFETPFGSTPSTETLSSDMLDDSDTGERSLTGFRGSESEATDDVSLELKWACSR